MSPQSNSQDDQDQHILMGHVSGAWGIKGWVHVASYADPAEGILDYQPWRLRRAGEDPGGGANTVTLIEGRRHNRGLVAHFEGIDDRDAAATLAGCEIWIESSLLPPLEDDEYYWRQLEGLNVEGRDGQPLGRIVRMMATGANDVMVVAKDETGAIEHLIPYIDHVVRAVDVAAGTLSVDWEVEYD